ncbi:MAG: SMP-30/gluconolactonase/LRE family protein [Acidimicrobiia bacterium]
MRVITSHLAFPEGPIARPDGSVVLVEIQAGDVTEIAPDGTRRVIAHTGGGPNGAAIGPDGACYVVNSGGWEYLQFGELAVPQSHLPEWHEGGSIQRVDLDTGVVTTLYTECDGVPLTSPNDIVFDAAGGMWVTDHGREHQRTRVLGCVYYAQPDGSSIRKAIAPVDSANGVGLSPDGRTLYVADTYSGRCNQWALAGPGELETPNPVFGNGGGMFADPGGYRLFDSLAVEANGNVVVASPSAGSICVFSPTGQLVDEVKFDDPIVTNICFGGPDLRTAYVTLSGTGRLVAMEWPRPGLRLAY